MESRELRAECMTAHGRANAWQRQILRSRIERQTALCTFLNLNLQVGLSHSLPSFVVTTPIAIVFAPQPSRTQRTQILVGDPSRPATNAQ